MGKALDLVNRFYDLTNNKNTTKGLEELLAEEMTFRGPLMQTSGAKQYIEMLGRLLKSHNRWKMIKQFEDGDDVCSIYELNLGTPSGGGFSVVIADWISVSNGGGLPKLSNYDRSITKKELSTWYMKYGITKTMRQYEI